MWERVKMDKKMKGKLILAGVSLGLTFTEAYFQYKKSKNKDEKIEKLITEIRNETSRSRIEVTPKHIEMRTEKLDVDTLDKSLVLSEEDGTQDMTMKEYHDLAESANKLVGRLDEDYLKKLHINILEGSFVYNMKDFHSLVAQHYMIQEAHKRKGND